MDYQQIRSRIINTLFITSFFVAIAASFYRYQYLKEFVVQIEVPCDPAKELCFKRDCSVDIDCPPDNYNSYRVFNLSGSVFATCKDTDNCESVCKSDAHLCVEVVCGDNPDDVCQSNI